MRNLPFILIGLLIVSWWFSHVFKPRRSGKLVASCGRVYARREDNPTLFCSDIMIQFLVALFFVCVILLGAQRGWR